MIWRAFPSMDAGYDPLRDFSRLQQEVNRLFNGCRGRAYEFPEVTVLANESETLVSAEVPGVEPEAISLTVANKTLTIEGERAADELAEGEVYHRQERGAGKFVRTVRLPYEVNADAVEARTRHGVLTVKLPRREETKPRSITIKSD